jgi:hypothetical protein
MYLTNWTNLFQSSLSGARTLVVRNAIAVQVSGLARLVEYTIFATKFPGAALFLVPPPFGSALSKAVRI